MKKKSKWQAMDKESESDMTNPKVSVEEVRAKRLEQEAEQAAKQAQAQTAQGEQSAPVDASTQLADILEGHLVQLPPSEQESRIGRAEQRVSELPDLDALLSSATPEQLAKIRQVAILKGLAIGSGG